MMPNGQASSGRRTLWVPIIFFEAYLNLSVVLFATGPWPWPVTNPLNLYLYLAAAHLALLFGYRQGIDYAKIRLLLHNSGSIDWVKLSLVVNLLLLGPTSFARSGDFIPNVVFGFSNPGEAYQVAFQRSSIGGWWVYIEYVRILLAPLIALAFPCVIGTWRVRSVYEKVAIVFIAAYGVAIYISIGTNKAIVDTVLLLPWMLFLAIRTGGVRLSRKRLFQLLIAIVLGVFLAFLFFGNGQIQREGGVASGRTFGPPILIDTELGNWTTVLFPETFQIYIESLLRYLGQGYYALSRTMLLDFDSLYGAGNSIFLSKNVESIFGIHDFSMTSFPGKLETAEGWGMMTLWDSIYPWIASDVGFIGSLFVIYFIGKYFAMSWYYSVRNMDFLSIAIFAYFIIMLFYFPANNQLMQNGESAVGFLILLFIWRLKMFFFTVNTKHSFGGRIGT